MVQNNMDVAIIAYHTGDDYANSFSIARLNYYGISGIPTVKFDGILTQVGASGNMYPNYLSKYNSRIAIPSSFTIEVEGTNSGLIDYEVNINVEKTASAIDNPVMHVVVTESHIPEYWGGLTEVNYVERIMLPNQNGTLLDFTGGNTEDITMSFTFDPDWVNEESELVVFLQNNQSKEVLQAVKYDIMDFGASNTNDATILNVAAPNPVCNNNFIPKVEIANYGLDDLTSLDIVYHVNNEPSNTYSWTGSLAYLESEIIVLSEVNFTLETNNNFTVEALSPNGEDDQYPSNNTYIVNMSVAENVPSSIYLLLKLDENPEETSWEMVDSEGSILYSGGSYNSPNQSIIETFTLNESDCYSFIIYDEGGDGLMGSGVYKLFYSSPPVYVAEGKDFGFEDQAQFEHSLTGEVEIVAGNKVEIYPNPTNQKTTVSFEVLKPEIVEMEVYNSLGAKMYTTGKREYSVGKHSFELNREGLTSGIYFIHLKIGDSTDVQKLIVK